VVRQAALSDLEQLVPLFDGYRKFYQCKSDPAGAHDFLSARFNHGESTLFIAHADNKPAGFAQLYPSFSSAAMKRTFILNDLYVHPELRNNSIATRLLAAATAYAQALGAARLTLSTAHSNAAAQALYESLGWKRDEAFRVYHFATDN